MPRIIKANRALHQFHCSNMQSALAAHARSMSTATPIRERPTNPSGMTSSSAGLSTHSIFMMPVQVGDNKEEKQPQHHCTSAVRNRT